MLAADGQAPESARARPGPLRSLCPCLGGQSQGARSLLLWVAPQGTFSEVAAFKQFSKVLLAQGLLG